MFSDVNTILSLEKIACFFANLFYDVVSVAGGKNLGWTLSAGVSIWDPFFTWGLTLTFFEQQTSHMFFGWIHIAIFFSYGFSVSF